MFKEALKSSVKKLTALRNRGSIEGYALIGGLALSAYLEPRSTGDIDFALSLGAGNLHDVAKRLKGQAHEGDIFDPLAGSVSFTDRTRAGKVPVQLIRFHSAFEEIVFENLETLQFDGVSIPIASPRALILLKLYAGGPIDLEDARQLLNLKTLKAKDLSYIETKAKRLRLLSRLKGVRRG